MRNQDPKPIKATAEEKRLDTARANGQITNREYTDGLERVRIERGR